MKKLLEREGERMMYLYSLNELTRHASRPAFEAAVSLIRDWSGKVKGQNVAAAACHYLTHNVMPMVMEGGEPSDRIPAWVDRVLFHPMEYRPQEVGWEEWMRFFGSDTAYVREDSKKGFCLLEGLPESLEWTKEQNAGVHFIPQIMGKEPVEGRKTRRTNDNVEACLTFLADMDGEKEADWEKLANSPILPTAVVETRRGWHAYWALNAPCSVLAWERVQETMNEYFRADKAIKYAAHSLRVPSSWHCKEVFEGGEPFYVQLVHASWKKVDYTDMELAFPPKPRVESGYTAGDYRQIQGVRLPSTTYIPSPGSHDILVSESGRVYAGVKEENAGLARKMVMDWYLGFKQVKRPTDEVEARRRCDELERMQYGRVVSR
jgi:hypothetical protein